MTTIPSPLGMPSVRQEFVKVPEEELNKKFHAVPISQVKEYWDRRPCNLFHSRSEVGTRQYFDEVEKRKYFVEPHIPGFAEFHKWRGKRVLEVGCGLGTESINFARAGAHLTCIDLSEKSLELAKKRFEVYGLSAEFYNTNAEQLSSFLPEGSKFDLIWSFGVIHHTPYPEACVEQFKKLLNPGGEIRIMVYSKISYKLFFLMRETGDWNFGHMDKLVARYSEAQTGCPVTFTYTFEEIRDELLKDWEVTKIYKAHIFCYNIEEYRKYNYVKEDCWKNVDDKMMEDLEKELGWHTCVIARPKQYVD